MLKIVVSLFIISLLTLQGASLVKTGQTQSYDENGDIVIDGRIKDDGYYQKGTIRSYTRNGEVVKDNITQLEWQDNEVVTKQWIPAIAYCSELTLDGGAWRLPSMKELETIIDYGKFSPALTDGVFESINVYDYWSSTSYGDTKAWYFGSYGNSTYYSQTFSLRVRCVRGEQLDTSNLFHERSSEMVSDITTNLQWQDDEDVILTERTWEEAIDYCENSLSLGGHDDWRLPNQSELLSIIDHSKLNPAINTNVFVNGLSNYYWSSTSHANTTRYAWRVNFYSGLSEYRHAKSETYYVRCVRDEEFGDIVPPKTSIQIPILMYLLN